MSDTVNNKPLSFLPAASNCLAALLKQQHLLNRLRFQRFLAPTFRVACVPHITNVCSSPSSPHVQEYGGGQLPARLCDSQPQRRSTATVANRRHIDQQLTTTVVVVAVLLGCFVGGS